MARLGCKPNNTVVLKWFGQNDLHPLAKLSSRRLPTSTSKSLVGEGIIPLLQPFTSGSHSYKFSARKKEVNTLTN